MQKTPIRILIAVTILISALSVVSCSPGGLFSGDMMYAPHREAKTDLPVLQSALMALSDGDRAGQITLTEAEFSSLLRLFLVDDSLHDGKIRDAQVWFEPDTVTIKLLLREGILPFIPSDAAANIEGELITEDGQLVFNMNRGGIGVIPIMSPALRLMIEDEISQSFGEIFNRTSPLNVKVNSGTITVDIP